MPQMAPLNWLILFLWFSMIFFMFNSINYYSFFYKTKSQKKTKTLLTYNWKW